jgi:hypothetical protein
MATIRLERTSKGYPDRLRAYRLRLDGQVAGRIRRGEELALDVEPGHRALQLTIDWCKSRTLELDLADSEVQLRCWSAANPLTALYWLTRRRSSYIGLEAVGPVEWEVAQADAARVLRTYPQGFRVVRN